MSHQEGATRADAPGAIIEQDGRFRVVGDWTLVHYERLRRVVAERAIDVERLDLDGIEALDTAGAAVIGELVGAERLAGVDRWAGSLPPSRQTLLRAVGEAMGSVGGPGPADSQPLRRWLGDVGQRAAALFQHQITLLGFIGLTLTTLFATLWRPRRWRPTSMVALVHETGFNALPIVALLTFLVGAVTAFLGATVLRDFGATIYTVNLVAYSFLREFGVLLAAILLAGRTASAFTAQLGSMKANEELDAIRVLGLDPIELLVLPRVLAMMVTLPILTFVGMLSGLFGGALVCLLALDIPIAQFLAILQRDIPLNHFLVGMGKALPFAFLVAVIGCLEGFKVSGSAQSVGEHTTSSVVQSIFMVILLDAVAALFFMEMGW